MLHDRLTALAVTLCLMFTACMPDPEGNGREPFSFGDRIALVESDPARFLSGMGPVDTVRITSPQEATDFLLYSLCRNYLDRTCFPQQERLQECIRIFGEKKSYGKMLEAMYLQAEAYHGANDLGKEVSTVEKAIDIALRAEDDVWQLYLYSHLSEMYFREYDLVRYVEYQTLANQCMEKIDLDRADVHVRLLAARNSIFSGNPSDAVPLLESSVESIGRTNVHYRECRRLLGLAYFRLERWQECVDEMNVAIEDEYVGKHLFMSYSILTYCYYSMGEIGKARECKRIAMQYDDDSVTGYGGIEFYKICAEFAEDNGNTPGQIECLEKVVGKCEHVIRELNRQTVDGAVQAYTVMREKRDSARQVRRYQYIAFGLLLTLSLLAIVHVTQKKNQAYKYLLLQQQIQALEKLRAIKDEARSIILNDFDIAKQIAMLKYTQGEKSRGLLRELEKMNILQGNRLLNAQWEQFYYHIDISFNDFHSRLVEMFPSLSSKEVQLCCMLVAGFRTDEIAAVWMQSVYSVHKYKTQVRKKVGAPEGADIVAFLNSMLPV